MSPDGRQLVLAALSAIYDKQALGMLQQQLQNTKHEKAIAPTVAMAAVSIIQHLGPKGSALPEKEMWGKGGVVQAIIGALFELAKEMGYSAPHSEFKPAYQIVEEQIDKSGFGNGPNDEQGEPDEQGQPQGGPPQQGQPNMMAQAAMGGQGMPGGMPQ
jgi:hypothetical protein